MRLFVVSTGILSRVIAAFMDKNIGPKNQRDDKSAGLPPVGKGVYVRHRGLMWFAYLDSEGKWRDCYTGDVLDGEVRPIEMASGSQSGES